jgi:hypothetical protein
VERSKIKCFGFLLTILLLLIPFLDRPSGENLSEIPIPYLKFSFFGLPISLIS